MKRMEPNLRQPIESGDLLYDLVLALPFFKRRKLLPFALIVLLAATFFLPIPKQVHIPIKW